VFSSRPFDQLSGSIDHVIDDVDDASNVLNQLVRNRRNTVIVGDSVANVEEVARRVRQRLERGNVEGELRTNFVSVPLVCFNNISYVERGFILYLGDLKWLFESWTNYIERRTSYHCYVVHVVVEIIKLISENEENGKLWLLGIATFKHYMKCKTFHPSVETIRELHPFITTCAGSLSLTLSLDRYISIFCF